MESWRPASHVPDITKDSSNAAKLSHRCPLQSGISKVVRKLRLSLSDTIRFWRGQSDEDPRPNKALRSEHLSWLLHGFPQLPLLLSMIQQGVTHHFRPVQQPNKGNLTSNHKSARTWSNALKRSVREGQDAGTYLVVDADAAAPWQDVHISPFGCVPKADADSTSKRESFTTSPTRLVTRSTARQIQVFYQNYSTNTYTSSHGG